MGKINLYNRIGSLIFRVLTGVSFLIISQSITLEAQNCNYDVNEIEPGSGLLVKRTEDMAIGKLNNQPFYIKSQCIGDKKFLKIRYFCQNDFFIHDKEPMVLTFLDNSKLEIPPRPNNKTEQTRTQFTKVSEMLIYDITQEQYNKIVAQQAKKITFKTWDNDFVDLELKDKFRLSLQQLLQCVNE